MEALYVSIQKIKNRYKLYLNRKSDGYLRTPVKVLLDYNSEREEIAINPTYPGNAKGCFVSRHKQKGGVHIAITDFLHEHHISIDRTRPYDVSTKDGQIIIHLTDSKEQKRKEPIKSESPFFLHYISISFKGTKNSKPIS